MTRRPRRIIRAFTVPEMLAVVAIIVIIISILLPNLNRARAHARLAMCLSDQHQFASAWRAYSLDNTQRLMAPGTGQYPHDWVRNLVATAPANPPNETVDAIKIGMIYPYVNDLAIYKCPEDPRVGYLRTYSMSHNMGGEGWELSQPVKRINVMPSPSKSMLLIEEPDYRGYNWGGWVIHPSYSSSKDSWIDWGASFHFNEGCTLSFADGHTEYWQWQDSRTPQIRDFNATTPNNADLKRLQDAYTPMP